MISEKADVVLIRLEQEEKNRAARGGVTNWILDRAGAQWIYDFICEHKPHVIVECGTSVGYSTIWLAEAVHTYGGSIFSIEKDPAKLARAKEHLSEAGREQVTLILGDAEQVLREWNKGSIDLLFLDANKKGYLPQFRAAEPHFSMHHAVVADNMIDMAERVADFNAYMASRVDYEVKTVAVGDGLLVAQKRG